jgi:tripartite ATP-independent transporter DctP family solute receptor
MKTLFSKLVVVMLALFLATSFTLGAGAKELKFGHTDSDKSLREDAAQFFAEKVKEYTEGRYTVKTFPNAVLGNDTKLLELEAMGAVDFVVSGSAIYGKHLNEMSILLSPFLVETFEQGWHLYDDSDSVKTWFNTLESKGFKMLATWESGFRCLNTSKPIKTPEDVKGLKLRLPPNPIHLTIWETLGATPVSMGIKEVYMAIEQGLVEGQENPPVATYSMRMHEVAPYVTLTNHVYGPISVSMSMKSWNALSPEDQEAIMKAAKEAAAYNRKAVVDNLDGILKKIEEEGGTVIKTDLKVWYQAVLPAYDKFKEDYGKDVVEKLMKEAEEIKAKYPAQ